MPEPAPGTRPSNRYRDRCPVAGRILHDTVETIHKFRIEARTCHLAQGLHRLAHGHARLSAEAAHQLVVHVRDGAHARRRRYEASADIVRMTAPVPPRMVIGRDLAREQQARVAVLAQQLGAGVGVPQVGSLAALRASLSDHLFGHGKQADVVQLRGEADLERAQRLLAAREREGLRERAHAHAVPARRSARNAALTAMRRRFSHAVGASGRPRRDTSLACVRCAGASRGPEASDGGRVAARTLDRRLVHVLRELMEPRQGALRRYGKLLGADEANERVVHARGIFAGFLRARAPGASTRRPRGRWRARRPREPWRMRAMNARGSCACEASAMSCSTR